MNIIMLRLFYLRLYLLSDSSQEEMVVIVNSKCSLLYFKVERSVARLISCK